MSSSTDIQYVTSDANIDALRIMLITTALQFIVHGIYTSLTVASTYTLWTQQRPLPARIALTVITLTMFVLSTTYVIEELLEYIFQLPSLGLNPNPKLQNVIKGLSVSLNLFVRINFVLSDGIVVWRAWVLWPLSRIVKCILVICMIASTAGSLLNEVMYLWSVVGRKAFLPVRTSPLVMCIPLVVTNVVATSLVGLKVWEYWHDVKKYLDANRTSKSRVEKVLILLVESGTFYCLLWIAYTYMNLEQNENAAAFTIVSQLVPQFTAIYPVIIVILAAGDKSHIEGTLSHSIRFANSNVLRMSANDIEQGQFPASEPKPQYLGTESLPLGR